MVKKCVVLLISVSLLLFSGCAETSGASAGKIIPPDTDSAPLEGKWTVLQELDAAEDSADTAYRWVGSDVQFASGAVAFGGHVWDKLSYKIKRVNAADYLMTKYISPSDLSVSDTDEVDVITVYAASNFLGEFMKLSDDKMAFFVPEKDLILKKVSRRPDKILGATDVNTQEQNLDSNTGASGVLLGIRIPVQGGYAYKTLWISADHQKLHPVLSADQLFFPRTSGFWELNVQDLTTGGKTNNILTAHNVTAQTHETVKKESETADRPSPDTRSGSRNQQRNGFKGQIVLETPAPAGRRIDYIGNDYVAIEKQVDGVSQLQVLPVDKLSSPAEIKISDLLGENGLKVFLNARERAAETLKAKGITLIQSDMSGENFGLARKNGHWFLVARINYLDSGKQEHTDFDLKIVPPASLIFYDTLGLNWHNIKDRIPDALDGFTSPNKDIALVRTKSKLTVYPIGAEKLEDKPLGEIDLPEGAVVIMAEWATVSYVGSWERSFRTYGATELTDNSVRIR